MKSTTIKKILRGYNKSDYQKPLLVTARHIYRDYKKAGGKLKYKEYKKVVDLIHYKLNRACIVDRYIYKLPRHLGHIYVKKLHDKFQIKVRDSKKEKGQEVEYHTIKKSIPHFCFYYDKSLGNYCRMTKKRIYSFKFINDWKNKELGNRGLMAYVEECFRDPYKKDYDALPPMSTYI